MGTIAAGSMARKHRASTDSVEVTEKVESAVQEQDHGYDRERNRRLIEQLFEARRIKYGYGERVLDTTPRDNKPYDLNNPRDREEFLSR